MDGKKAVGTDGITKEEYGARLEENLEELEEKLKKKAYKPKPAKKSGDTERKRKDTAAQYLLL